MTVLTWWERDELIEHLTERPDLWSFDQDSQTWLRTDTEGTPVLGLLISPPNNTGRFRQHQLRAVPLAWEPDFVAQYIEELCTKWTCYGVRLRITELLHLDDGIQMELQTAKAVAVAICAIEQNGLSDPEEASPPPVQQSLPDLASGFPERSTVEPDRRTFLLSSGGFISLAPRSGMLSVQLSLKLNGGFTGSAQLHGFVRPKNGNLPQCLSLLFDSATEQQPVRCDPEPPEETDEP